MRCVSTEGRPRVSVNNNCHDTCSVILGAKIFNVHCLRKQLCYAGRVWCTPGLSERICYGIDIDCKYVDVAVQRWEKVSGKVAKLASNGQTLEEAREERHQ